MKLRSFWHLNEVTYFLIDYVLLWSATVFAFKLSPSFRYEILIGPFLTRELYFVGYGMPAFMALALQLADLQRPWATFRPIEIFVRSLTAIGIGMIAFAGLHAAIEFELVGRFVLLFGLLFGAGFVFASRMFLWRLAVRGSHNVVLYGNPATLAKLTTLAKRFNVPIRLVGHTSLAELRTRELPGKGESGAALVEYCRDAHIDEIVVDVPESLHVDERRALSQCTRVGIPVADLSLFFERTFGQVYVEGLHEAWFWSYDAAHAQPWYFACKRICDIVLSLAGLAVCLPFAPLVALAIKLQDRGPIIYSQQRLGRHSRPFTIFKFRSMSVNAETSGAQWARLDDARATRFGRFLRRTRLDEVPQFWNILIGDMSFIGPRPERPEFVETIERELPFYGYRHLIKPGLSGWAQINYPYGASVEDAHRKLAYDLYYLKHASITMDLLIVFRTIAAMMKGSR